MRLDATLQLAETNGLPTRSVDKESRERSNIMRKKLVCALIALVSLAFVVGGIVMVNQALDAKADVKASIAAENITLGNSQRSDGTTDEVVAVVIPPELQGTPVDSPEKLLMQRDVIRGHTLVSTDGNVFAEMPKSVPQLDENGQPVLDENNKPVMVPNKAREIWIQSTAWQTALTHGYMAWKLADLVLGLGIAFLVIGGTGLFTVVLWPKK